MTLDSSVNILTRLQIGEPNREFDSQKAKGPEIARSLKRTHPAYYSVIPRDFCSSDSSERRTKMNNQLNLEQD